MQSRNATQGELTLLIGTLVLALLFWYAAFVLPLWIFWGKMSVATVLLAAVSLFALRPDIARHFTLRLRYLAIGIGSAALLYALFWLGKLLLTLLSPAAEGAISSVYSTKAELPPWAIALVLLFITSPCEEIFWRGFVQRVLTNKIGKTGAFLGATLAYTGVHVVTLNIPLILAALTAGAVWGWIYLREESVVPGLISHALWAVFIFVVFPVA